MNKGFTLIEVIAVLLLVGVLVLASTIALLPMVEGFMQVGANVDAAQKSQFAMGRMVRELTSGSNVVAATQQSVIYDFLDPAGVTHRRTLAWGGAGTALTLDGVALCDDVGQFQLRYYARPDGAPAYTWTAGAKIIEIVLGTASTSDVYTNRVRLRNLPNE